MKKFEEIWFRWSHLISFGLFFIGVFIVGVISKPFSDTNMIFSVVLFLIGIFYQILSDRTTLEQRIDRYLTSRNVLWLLFLFFYTSIPIRFRLGHEFNELLLTRNFIMAWHFLIGMDLVGCVVLMSLEEINIWKQDPNYLGEEEEEE